jgi:hypothetical protein
MTRDSSNKLSKIDRVKRSNKGDVNIKDIMRAAKKSSVKHYFIEDESSRVIKQLPLSLQYIKSLK